MNLSANMQSQLDKPTKDFEVAFRCFVVDILLTKYPDETSLKSELQKKVDLVKDANIILSGKICSSIKALLGNREWKGFWDNITFIHDCYMQKSHTISHDVTYLKQTILMTYAFQELFQDYILTFQNVENYIFYSNQYYEVRNALSHRASYIITREAAFNSIHFIQTGLGYIPEEYYWYYSASDISADIISFENILNHSFPRIENLATVPFPSNEIVCREPEIQNLFKSICGWDGERRLRNRKHFVCIFGYGGVGKTSLVTEFLRLLIDQMSNESYCGLRPFFTLFYSAKEQILDYSITSGDLYLRGLKSQFSNSKQLFDAIYRDLGIDSFDDSWEKEGLLIIDNFESLSGEERKKIIDFISYDLPTSIQVIMTTRIPEPADEQIQLKGFQNEAGMEFINKYLEKNKENVKLSLEQQSELIRHTYGNSLVLVLALKRLSSGITTYRSLISEMERLPKNNADSYVSQFMFQNTIEEVMRCNPESKDIIETILICLSIRQEALNADILASAHRSMGVTVGEIEDVLKLLANYLIVEKVGDVYHINEFANQFILVSMSPSLVKKQEWESKILSAIREDQRRKITLDEMKRNNPELSELIKDWNGENEQETYAICRAFTLYSAKEQITRKNAAYELDQLEREFDSIEHQYSSHPYVYYQWARILKELRQDRVIGDEYNDKIRTNYERSIMLIDTPTFNQIKSTKTYPSILWIFSQFLLDIGCLDECSHYAYSAVQNFKHVGINSGDIYDALAVYGLAEIGLFSQNNNKEHLKNSRNALDVLSKISNLKRNAREHKDELARMLNKYKNFRI